MDYIPTGACGYVIEIPAHDVRLYYAGTTNLFSDMKLINDFYKPNVAMLPISGNVGMDPRTAAYALKNFLPGVKTVIPMMFRSETQSGSVMNGTTEDFEREMKEVEAKAVMVHPKKFIYGQAYIE